MPRSARGYLVAVVLLVLTASASAPLVAAHQAPTTGLYTIDQILAPAYPVEITAAKKAERIAWISYERGMRNVYTAAGPAFEPVKLTDVTTDDGNDMTDVALSDDGGIAVFVRGHTPNRDGWIANPTSEPDGAERAIWAVRTSGGPAWRIAEGAAPTLSPDGRWVAFARDGQIHRAPVDPNLAAARGAGDDTRLFTAFGRNSSPMWSPDGRKIAFVSQRSDHSFIGIYDVDRREVRYMAPGVDFDSSPTFSPDGSRIAFIRRPGLTFGQQAAGGGRGFRGGRGQQSDEPADGLRRAAFAGGYTLSFWLADTSTGVGREFWHGQPDDNSIQPRNFTWAGDNVVFQAEPGNWQHYYSVPIPAVELEAGPWGHEFSTSAPSRSVERRPRRPDAGSPGGSPEYCVDTRPTGALSLLLATNVGPDSSTAARHLVAHADRRAGGVRYRSRAAPRSRPIQPPCPRVA